MSLLPVLTAISADINAAAAIPVADLLESIQLPEDCDSLWTVFYFNGPHYVTVARTGRNRYGYAIAEHTWGWTPAPHEWTVQVVIGVMREPSRNRTSVEVRRPSDVY